MKHKLLFTLGLIILGWGVFATVPTEAVTGAGQYYALPSWDQTTPANLRFLVLTNMSSQAVLDRETGLVWEQAPSISTFIWEDAQTYCNTLRTGNRMGWRVPTIQELASLVDPSKSGPALPTGHPFSNVPSSYTSYYWSATTLSPVSGFGPSAWTVWFFDGAVASYGKTVNYLYVWCVLGGRGVDTQ
jgi:hypothetical protein